MIGYYRQHLEFNFLHTLALWKMTLELYSIISKKGVGIMINTSVFLYTVESGRISFIWTSDKVTSSFSFKELLAKLDLKIRFNKVKVIPSA